MHSSMLFLLVPTVLNFGLSYAVTCGLGSEWEKYTSCVDNFGGFLGHTSCGDRACSCTFWVERSSCHLDYCPRSSTIFDLYISAECRDGGTPTPGAKPTTTTTGTGTGTATATGAATDTRTAGPGNTLSTSTPVSTQGGATTTASKGAAGGYALPTGGLLGAAIGVAAVML